MVDGCGGERFVGKGFVSGFVMKFEPAGMQEGLEKATGLQSLLVVSAISVGVRKSYLKAAVFLAGYFQIH